MNTDRIIKIPEGSIPYIALQRTQYQSILKKLFRKCNKSQLYDRYILGMLEPIRRRKIQSAYNVDLQAEFSSIMERLPDTANAVLDIGCGMGGIDVFLYKYYNDDIDVYLFDIDGISENVNYFFKNDPSFYCSLNFAKNLLMINGVEESRIHLTDVSRQPLPDNAIFDVVLSLISWGFHYPVATYLDYVCNHLSSSGVLIMDIRKETGGLDLIRARFRNVDIVETTPKFDRICARRVV